MSNTIIVNSSSTYTAGGNYNRNIAGTDAVDWIITGDGNKTVYAGKSSDLIEVGWGDAGADTLYGGSGKNNLTGGEGPDTFVFGTDAIGNNSICDYETAIDVISFVDGVSYSEGTVTGQDVLLNLSTGGTVSILNAVGQNIAFNYGNGNTSTRIFS